MAGTTLEGNPLAPLAATPLLHAVTSRHGVTTTKRLSLVFLVTSQGFSQCIALMAQHLCLVTGF